MRCVPRRGSILLLCLAIITALMLIAFAYVRVASLQHEANDSENRALLAREAAKMGLAHATELILSDYVNGPFSRHNDASHGSFVSFDRPYESDYDTDMNVIPQLVNVDDVPAENNLVQSFGGPYNDWNSLANGQHVYDGRGRFYEPEFYNRSVVGFDPAATAPNAPVRFGNAAPALPQRADGLFYDAHLRRIPYDNADPANDARVARSKARYRLRYAVGVMDLDGTILANGDQGVDYRDLTFPSPLSNNADPAHLLTREERVVRWKHALPQIIYASSTFGNTQYGWGAGVSGGARAEHVFMGRGTISNYARGAANAPVTFPYMYRNGAVRNFKKTDSTGPADALYLGAAAGGVAIPNDQDLVHALTGAQFSFDNFDQAIEGRGLDGNDGKAHVLGRFSPFGRGLVRGAPGRWSGNVDTPWCVNIMTAPTAVIYGMIAGYMPPGAISVYYHQKPPTRTPPIANADWVGDSYSAAVLGLRDLFVQEMSPAFGPGFGNYVTPSRGSPSVTPDYHTPDLRTANQRYPGIMAFNGNPGTGWVSDNLGMYLRSTVKPDWATSYGGQVTPTGRPEIERMQYRDKERAIRPLPTQPRTELTYWLRQGAGGPSLLGSDQTRTNAPAAPYPGWSSTTAYVIGANVQYNGQSYNAIMASTNLQPDANPSAWTLIPTPLTWDNGAVGAHPDSIWDVVGSAMAAAVATARGQYFQYPAQNAIAATHFNGAPWSGPRVATIRDIDALFVTNIGSSFTRPNDPTPVPVWRERENWPIHSLETFTPTWNLARLRTENTSVQVITTTSPVLPTLTVAGTPRQVDLGSPQAPIGLYNFRLASWNDPGEPRFDSTKPSYSADERTAVIELIINDARLSFFGSSPGYSDDRGDGMTFFRALDLNGDGKAHCSGFASVGSAAERALHIDQYTTSLDANGVAIAPVQHYFANTGNFFLGRSRFWRVMVRGEVWDNVLQTAVNSAQLDSVLCVDPVNAAQEWTGAVGDTAAGHYSTHVIYQRWFFNAYRGLMPRQQ